MAKREKIILIIMAAVVVFGVYDLLFSSGAKKKPVAPVAGVAEISKFITDVAVSLKDDHSETNMYILSRARAEWSRDPFWHVVRRPEVKTTEAKRFEAKTEAAVVSRKETKPEETRVYTGYLEMGGKKLAIINGAEYLPGDELGRGGPVVKSIDPKQVILVAPGTTAEIILPLKETK